ncbi:MAG: hypothetical protein ABI980_10810 [Nitrospirota bacterium]
MVSIPKVIGVMSCGFLLCLGLSHVAQAENAASAADDMQADQVDQKEMAFQMKSFRTIQGEVLRVEGANYLIQGAGREGSEFADRSNHLEGRQDYPRRSHRGESRRNQSCAVDSLVRMTN